MLKKPSKKNAKFPSHEFVRQNAEDIFGSMATLMVMAVMFQPTQEVAGRIVFLSPIDGKYSNSLYDFGNYIFFGLCWVVISVNVQHYIVNFLTRHSNYSRTKLYDFTFSVHYTLFYLSSLILGVYALFKTFSPAWSRAAFEEVLKGFVEGTPEQSTNYYIKLLVHLQISYYVHHFLMVYLLRVQRDFVLKHIAYISLYFGALVVAQRANCFTVLLLGIILHSLEQYLWNLYFCFNVRFKGVISSLIYLLWNVVFFATAASLVVSSALLMTNDMRKALVTLDLWKHVVSFRFAMLCVVLGGQICLSYRAIRMLVNGVFGWVESSAEGDEVMVSSKVDDAASKKGNTRKRKK